MPRFEVFIPPAEADALRLIFRVDADDWMAALKLGMEKLGEQAPTGQNVLVDLQDDQSLHVTETRSGRVFRIRELTDAESQKSRVKLHPHRPSPPPTGTGPTHAPQIPYDRGVTTLEGLLRSEAITERSLPPVHLPEPEHLPLHAAPSPLRPAEPKSMLRRLPEDIADETTRPGIQPSPLTLALADSKTPRTQRGVPRGQHRSRPPREVVELEEPTTTTVAVVGRPRRAMSLEDVLEEVFDRVQSVYRAKDIPKAMSLLLDLALEKVPAESGSVLLSDASTGNLSFVAARGPKAQELLAAKLTLPVGRGVAGFCATEGVSLALSDVQRDPRYDARVADTLSYEVRSLLCAPMMSDGRVFGVMQLLNRRGQNVFEEHEMGLLSYVAHQGARYLVTR